MSAQPSLTLQRRINAAPAKVFRASTEAAQLMKWGHPGDAEVTRAELDARVDGRYLMRFLHQFGWSGGLDSLECYFA